MNDSMKKLGFWTTIPLCLLFVGLCAGCSKIESQFVFDEATEKLIPEASVAVKKSLLSTFGSPTNPRIPAFFPVDRGGIVAEIEEAVSEDRTQIKIKIDDSSEQNGKSQSEQLQISAGQLVEFLFDPEEAFDVTAEAMEEEKEDPFKQLSGLKVVSFDSKTGVLKLDKPLPEIELIDWSLPENN